MTNLNDSGSGSFRDAVSASHRTVVFDVAGYIKLSSAVSVKSDITIDGTTAPDRASASWPGRCRSRTPPTTSSAMCASVRAPSTRTATKRALPDGEPQSVDDEPVSVPLGESLDRDRPHRIIDNG
ncbi:hypothetical protein GCM10023195_05280 [Actinoallomurus liliacearum]|uniref:Uncharacterized protein n=1 Tax=Actinoallomurus liliacearum TaxID=1080073 RepID=A0ABP8T9S1_9ACTN